MQEGAGGMDDANKEALGNRLTSLGLPLHGFCPFAAIADRLLPCRALSRLPKQAATVIVCLFPYRFPDEGDTSRNLSRYACVPDYHTAAGNVLQKAAACLAENYAPHAFVPFIDNSPIPEVYTAALAGLGVVGDNGLLIHPVYGSYVFIGAIVTDWDLSLPPPDSPRSCLHCGRCAAACPGGCILSHKERQKACLSAISQKKGDLSPAEERLLQNSPLLWGCDTCQEVCPLNGDIHIEPHPCFDGYDPLLTPALLDKLELTGRLREKAYGWRGTAVLRRNLRLCPNIPCNVGDIPVE